MKRFLLFCMVVGLFAGQASAAMFILDTPTARTFTQQSTNTAGNDLQLVIDYPGTAGSTTYVDDGFFGTPADYGETMQFAVGFAGIVTSLVPGDQVISIGKASNLTGFTDLGIHIANDNDDTYKYNAFVSFDNMTSTVTGPTLDLIQDTLGFVSLDFSGSGLGAAVTNFGFDIDLLGPSTSNHFHTSVVPVPAAVILGILGLSVAGIKLRKFA